MARGEWSDMNIGKNIKKTAQYKVIILGILIAVSSSLIGASILSVFIQNEYLEIKDAQYAVFIIQLLSSFFGAFVSGKLTTKSRIISCGMVIGGYLLFVVCCGIILFEGLTSGFWSGIIAIIAGFIASFSLCAIQKKPTGSRRRRVATR